MTEFERFKNEVDEALKNINLKDKSELNEIKVCDTPEILKKCGMKDLPMLYRKGHLRDALKEKDEGKHHHGLTIKQIYNLPKNLLEPALILKNKNENLKKCPIIVLNDFDNEKLPLFVVIKMETEGTYELKSINTNDILSIYGRKNFENYLNKVIEKDGLIYYDKEKVHNIDINCGLRLSTRCNIYEPNKILQQFDENVKKKLKSFEKIQGEYKNKSDKEKKGKTIDISKVKLNNDNGRK